MMLLMHLHPQEVRTAGQPVYTGSRKARDLALFIMLLAVEMGSLGHYLRMPKQHWWNQQSRLQNYLRGG